jgi:phage terminase Nu1 subunit (DNA packaging protein)
VTLHAVPTETRYITGDVRELPIREDEPYLTRQELAHALGISVSAVDDRRREGMPSETWGMRTRRFQLSRCKAWLRERERKRAA